MLQNVRQVILKVTRGCNLRCSYCYVFDKEKFHEEEMSDEIYDFFLRRWFSECKLADRKDDNPHDSLDLIFHGGEPLKIGKVKFSRFCKKAYQYARLYNKNLRIGIQTNATLIDEEWIAIFRKWRINPGISIDGFGDNNNLREGTFKLTNNILMMKSYGVEYGPLMVLHKNNYKDIVQILKTFESLGHKSIKINRAFDVVEVENSKFELTIDELMKASIDICELMFSGSKILEGTLVDRMKNFLRSRSGGIENVGDEFAHCYSRYCGAGKNLIEIEPDGTLQFCGRNSRRSELSLNGTIFHRDILEIQDIARQWKFHKYKADSINYRKCNECYAQSICDGGCMSFSFQRYNLPKIDTVTCQYHKRLYKYFTSKIFEIENLMSENKLLDEGDEGELNSNFYL